MSTLSHARFSIIDGRDSLRGRLSAPGRFETIDLKATAQVSGAEVPDQFSRACEDSNIGPSAPRRCSGRTLRFNRAFASAH